VAPSRSPFAYAVVRIVPDIEREEFLNAGLILFCRPRRYLRARTALDTEALDVIHPGNDAPAIAEQLRFIESVADGTLETAPFTSMSQSERFHWLTTPRSTLVQPGPLHAGTSGDPDATFDHLFEVLVTRAKPS
jgi:Protein of unknown function (DUF3037)